MAALLLHPERVALASELAEELSIPLSTVTQEAGRLAEAGILATRLIGRRTAYSADPSGRLTASLTDLVAATFGPVDLVQREFVDLPAQTVVVFGSWAARWLGEPGPFPADVDVLVLADRAVRAEVYAAAERVEEATGYPVNTVLRPASAWQDDSDPLIDELRRRPFVVALGALPNDATREAT